MNLTKHSIFAVLAALTLSGCQHTTSDTGFEIIKEMPPNKTVIKANKHIEVVKEEPVVEVAPFDGVTTQMNGHTMTSGKQAFDSGVSRSIDAHFTGTELSLAAQMMIDTLPKDKEYRIDGMADVTGYNFTANRTVAAKRLFAVHDYMAKTGFKVQVGAARVSAYKGEEFRKAIIKVLD